MCQASDLRRFIPIFTDVNPSTRPATPTGSACYGLFNIERDIASANRPRSQLASEFAQALKKGFEKYLVR